MPIGSKIDRDTALVKPTSSQVPSDSISIGIMAPIAGWLCPLSEVPDPAFSQELLGPGVAIDPVDGCVRAPCNGVVAGLAEAGHAVTIETETGAQILIHVGVDTVALAGQGFSIEVSEGDRVETGDLLLTFDLDAIARNAKSAMTPIVLVTHEDHAIAVCPPLDRYIAAGDPLVTLTLKLRKSAADTSHAPKRGQTIRREVVVPMPQGLHARPAARLANCAKQFDADLRVTLGEVTVNARSPTALMGLGAKFGASVEISARGKSPSDALEAFASLLEAGAGDDITRAPAPSAKEPSQPSLPTDEIEPIRGPARLSGVCAAPGLAIGPIYRLERVDWTVERDAADAQTEQARLSTALETVYQRLSERGRHEAPSEESGDLGAGIFAAHLAILEDEALLESARQRIAEGCSAAFAWRSVMREQAHHFEGLEDTHLAERAADFIDLEKQLLAVLLGEPGGVQDDIPDGAIVIAEDLYPSDIEMLAKAGTAGVCVARGGATSHAAILATSAGLPAVVAFGNAVLGAPDGVSAILDADSEFLHIGPSETEIDTARVRRKRKDGLLAQASARSEELCYTAEGTRIEVLANLGAPSQAARAVDQGAEGCGLLRTEFMFLERAVPPSENEQFEQYQAIADGLAGRSLIVRTLDIGGDKPARYLNRPAEDNPALGVRGVRLYQRHPELFEAQLRAILRVTPAENCAILLPMVSSAAELETLRERCDALAAELGRKEPVRLGVMIETPASALIADQLAGNADFLSIGTNDLTQYTLAMDRGHELLAREMDALHPAVLRLIAQTTNAAARKDCDVGVCGGLAGDVFAIPLLLGLGVTELSMATARIAPVKMVVRSLSLQDCRQVAEHALSLDSAQAVRAFVRERLPQLQDWI